MVTLNRIIIIGCPGSGKTTLGRELAAKLKLPLVHLDKLGWHGTWDMTEREEFDRLLLIEVNKPEWIIEGNYGRTIPLRLQYCDTVIYLDYPRRTCMAGVLKRVIKNHGITRPEMGGNCPEKIDLEFLKCVWQFNKKNRKKYNAMLANEKDRKVVILHSRSEAAEFLSRI